MMRGMFAVCSFITLVFCTAGAQAQTETPVPTVLDGVYSDAQARRGQASYGTWCSACHGEALEGVSAPALTTGSRFVERWREGSLDLLHSFLKERMPPRRGGANVTPIPDTDYLDILTYILKVNGYRAGPNELTLERLAEVMFVGPDGPKPVPDGALVVTVGCLNPTGESAWALSNAVEPVRTRTSTSTPAELSSSSQRSLGRLSFRLTDLEAVPGFDAAAHRGSRVQAKGYLTRQPNAERISLHSMDVLNPACE